MLVGLQHGGGVNSRTACTLMTMDEPGGPVKMSDRGADWESHGNNRYGIGVELYEGARAWNASLFHDFWYLDAKIEASTIREFRVVSAVDVLARAAEVTTAKAQQILVGVTNGLRRRVQDYGARHHWAFLASRLSTIESVLDRSKSF